jgi:hypothetical protein
MTATKRAITVHAFSSAKGGVGKSSLAVAAAHIVALQPGDRRSLVIDCDLTGSSLADGMRLRAPGLPRDGRGTLNLLATKIPPSLTVDETTALIDQRMTAKEGDEPSFVPFFNDALTFVAKEPDVECNVAAMAWTDEVSERVLYLPSSSAKADIRLALAWLYDPDSVRWTRRFAWVLDQIATTIDGLTDVMIDLPPGLFGFSQSVLTLLTVYLRGEPVPEGFPDAKAKVDWRVNPFLVTSPDTNDLFTAVRSVGPLSARLDRLRLVVNQDNRPDDTRRIVEKRFPVLGLEGLLHPLPKNESLGRLFRDGRLVVDGGGFWRRVAEVLRLEAANGAV